MKNKKVLVGILGAVLLVIVAVCGYFYHTIATVANSENICAGVVIDGVDVGNMTVEEAKEAVDSYEESLAEKKVTLTYENHSDSISLSELGYSSGSVKDAVTQAYEIGKEGSMWKRYKAIKSGAGKGNEIEIEKSLDKTAFQSYIDDNADAFVKVATNASVKRENGAFVIIDEQEGMEVPVDENLEALDTYLNGEWDKEDFTFELTANTAEPEYTREDMESLTDVLGTYTTSFGSSTANRITNIRTACSKIDGHMLYPGETFSVMDLIAPLTKENGYELAGSYSSGEVIESYGGGVCQVSTTLYNAVLLSELDVAERYNHQMIVSYVEPSFDAAVSDSGNQDFRFTNSLDVPIYIEGYVNGYTITFTIYGKETRAQNRTIEYKSEILAKIDPGKDIVTKDKNLEEGKERTTQSAHTGYRAKLIKNVYIDGVLESTTDVNSSYYAPSARRVTVGTKKTEDTTEETTEETTEKTSSDKKNTTKKTTEAPTTEAPATEAPATEAPATEATATEAAAEGTE